MLLICYHGQDNDYFPQPRLAVEYTFWKTKFPDQIMQTTLNLDMIFFPKNHPSKLGIDCIWGKTHGRMSLEEACHIPENGRAVKKPELVSSLRANFGCTVRSLQGSCYARFWINLKSQ